MLQFYIIFESIFGALFADGRTIASSLNNKFAILGNGTAKIFEQYFNKTVGIPSIPTVAVFFKSGIVLNTSTGFVGYETKVFEIILTPCIITDRVPVPFFLFV